MYYTFYVAKETAEWLCMQITSSHVSWHSSMRKHFCWPCHERAWANNIIKFTFNIVNIKLECMDNVMIARRYKLNSNARKTMALPSENKRTLSPRICLWICQSELHTKLSNWKCAMQNRCVRFRYAIVFWMAHIDGMWVGIIEWERSQHCSNFLEWCEKMLVSSGCARTTVSELSIYYCSWEEN